MNSKSEQYTSVELPLGRHLAVVARFYYGALTNKLNHLDIDRYYSVLLLVSKSTEGETQQMIGDQLHIDKASMVRVIDNLEEKNYIKREVKPGDRRCHLIRLTEKGKEIIPIIESSIIELNAQMMKNLSALQQDDFLKTLCAISKNLQELPADEVVVEYQRKKPNLKTQ
ncbi:MAG: MarR family transcriptional regulator [Bacteroidia bacterium]